MPSIESNQLLLAATAAAEDKKAEDLRILALDPSESGLTDYFLICNGTNDRQNLAISDEIELRLKREFGVYPNSVEGRRQAEWILMDYVDFIVHVFSPEKRAFYGLERLRKSAKTLSVDDINAEVKAMVAATRAKAPTKAAAERAATPKKVAPKKVAAKKTIAKKATKPVAAKKTAAKKAAPKKAAKKTSPKKALVKTPKKPSSKSKKAIR
ncbi:ribosome silencing factor [Edaphobacter bradus]|uniref:ribosome silencing factor n=1 Tax=Edaphobacter bradus TaxID=2259016 RepID=UPI0021E0A20A|nr:ribosome silencing factor [Edaphobacter bradus]